MPPHFPNQMPPPLFPSLPGDLHFAAKKNNVAKLAELLALVDVDVIEREKYTALSYAAAYGSLDAMRLLLAHGANVNAPDAKRRTPLHVAIVNQQAAATDLLLQHGADVSAEDKYGNPPLNTCLFAGKIDLAILHNLLAHGASPTQRGAYEEAQRSGYIEACKIMQPYLAHT